MRTRIRALIAVTGIAIAALFVLAPASAYAAGTPQPEQPLKTESARHCFDLLAKGGDVSVDDCQKAPSPLKPANNEIIWGSAAFLVLLIAMWKFGVPAVRNMEKAREDRIRNDLESAEKSRTEAEAEKAQYLAQIAGAKDEAGRIIEEARQAAEECYNKLASGGSIDDCQKAPSPLKPENNEIIWGALAFLVLLVAMWKWGVPAVKNMEAAREERIRNDLEGAEKARTEAEAEKAQYLTQIGNARAEAGQIIDEARQSAEQVRRDLVARAEQDANEIRERAQADIANQRAQAMASLRGEVAQLSIDLAGRIVERNLDNDTNRQLVNSFLEQAGRSN